MTLKGSEAPSDGGRNLEPHYRAKGTSEILCLLHEINEKTMELGEDPFKLMMEIDRLARPSQTGWQIRSNRTKKMRGYCGETVC